MREDGKKLQMREIQMHPSKVLSATVKKRRGNTPVNTSKHFKPALGVVKQKMTQFCLADNPRLAGRVV